MYIYVYIFLYGKLALAVTGLSHVPKKDSLE